MFCSAEHTITAIYDGNGIDHVEITYAAHSSATDPPGEPIIDGGQIIVDIDGKPLTNGDWQTTVPVVPQGQYLWTRTVTYYTNGDFSIAYAVGYAGQDGQDGQDGEAGAKGDQGVSVVKVTPQYYLSTSNSALSGGEWTNVRPAVTTGKFLWTRDDTLLSDNTHAYSDPVYDSTITNLVFDVDSLNNEITTKVSETNFHNMIVDDTLIQDINATSTEAKQTADKIYWLVDDTSSQTQLELTPLSMDAISTFINLNGVVQFTGLSDQAVEALTSGNLIVYEDSQANLLTDEEDPMQTDQNEQLIAEDVCSLTFAAEDGGDGWVYFMNDKVTVPRFTADLYLDKFPEKTGYIVYRQATTEDVVNSSSAWNYGDLGTTTKTVSGEIVSFDDAKDNMPLQEAMVNMEPIQDLHGYDHPWPAGGGKNLYDANSINALSSSGVTITVNDGAITFNGTATANAYFSVSQTGLASGQYVFSFNNPVASGDVHVSFRSTAGGYFSDTAASEVNKSVAISGEPNQVTLYVRSGATLTNFVIRPQLESGSTATAFAPYSNICPITGRTGVEVTRCGKNLLKNNGTSGSNGGITWTMNSDGSIALSGTAGDNYVHIYINTLNTPQILANGTVQLVCSASASFNPNISGINFQNDIYIDGTYSSSIQNGTPTKQYSGGKISVGVSRLRIAPGTVIPNGTVYYPLIAVGSATDKWIPYQGETYNIQLFDDDDSSYIESDTDHWEYGTINGQTGNNGTGSPTNRIRTIGYIELTAGKMYVIEATSGYQFWVYKYSNDEFTGNVQQAAVSSIVYTPDNTGSKIRLVIKKKDGTDITLTDIGTVFSITVKNPSTVYGGTLDVTTGELIVDKAMVGISSFTFYDVTSDGGLKYGNVENAGAKMNGSGITNMVPVSNDGAWASTTPVAQVSPVVAGRLRIYGDFNSQEELEEWGAGLQFVYELANPVTYQLTPQEIKTLTGTNVVFSDADSMEVSYIEAPGTSHTIIHTKDLYPVSSSETYPIYTTKSYEVMVYEYDENGKYLGINSDTPTSSLNYVPSGNVGKIGLVAKNRTPETQIDISDMGSIYNVTMSHILIHGAPYVVWKTTEGATPSWHYMKVQGDENVYNWVWVNNTDVVLAEWTKDKYAHVSYTMYYPSRTREDIRTTEFLTNIAYQNAITDYTTINGGLLQTHTVVADSLFVETLSSITAAIGELTSGIIRSSNYNYTSGKFANSGMKLDFDHATISSKNFAIDASGNLYIVGEVTATSGTFTGTIQASTGYVGPWTINDTAIYKGSATWGTSGGKYFGDNGLSIGSTFKVTSAGVLSATGATISGTLTAGENSVIGPWHVTSSSIWYGNSAHGNANGLYFGTNGLSVKNKFVVDSTGKLEASDAKLTSANVSGTITTDNITATGGTIGGITLHSSYGLYTNSKTTATSTNSGFLISKSGAIYIGGYSSSTGACPFQVTSGGILTARGATITGTITTDNITATGGTIGGINMNSSYGLYTNSKTSATSTQSGFLISKGGGIYVGGYNSTDNACPFQVTSDGALTAKNATISGNITASTGTIGGWKVSSDGFTFVKPYYNDTTLLCAISPEKVNLVSSKSSSGLINETSITPGSMSLIRPIGTTTISGKIYPRFYEFYIRPDTSVTLSYKEYTSATNITSSNRFHLATNGNLTISGTLSQGSDERRKNIFKWDENVDNFILDLNPINFVWKDMGDDCHYIGIGAQTTLKLLKQHHLENYGLVKYEDDAYFVSYQELAPMMLPTLQKAYRTAISNEEKIAQLEAQIEELKRRIS